MPQAILNSEIVIFLDAKIKVLFDCVEYFLIILDTSSLYLSNISYTVLPDLMLVKSGNTFS